MWKNKQDNKIAQTSIVNTSLKLSLKISILPFSWNTNNRHDKIIAESMLKTKNTLEFLLRFR